VFSVVQKNFLSGPVDSKTLCGSKKALSGPGGSKKTFVVKKLKFYHEQ